MGGNERGGKGPTCGLHVVDPDDTAAGRVPVGGVVDGPTPQVVRLLVCQVVPDTI
jgi:hypothetical protein